MTTKEVHDHLLTVHKLTVPLKGEKSGQLFLDSAGEYSDQYEWIFPGVKLWEVWSGPKR